MIPPFGHPDMLAGQARPGLEVIEQMLDLDTAIVPVSGEGLISGVGAALKGRKSSIRVIGVSMERGAAMQECQRQGGPVMVEELPTLADSPGGGMGLDNRYTFSMVRDLVEEIVLVNEAEIAQAIRHADCEERQIVEGAVGIAARITGRAQPTGPTAVFMRGGNIDMALHHSIVSGEDVDLANETPTAETSGAND